MIYYKHRCGNGGNGGNRFVLSDIFRIFAGCMRYQKRVKNKQNILKTGDFALLFMKNISLLRRIHDRLCYSYRAFVDG
jgi:hypothetical protein